MHCRFAVILLVASACVRSAPPEVVLAAKAPPASAVDGMRVRGLPLAPARGGGHPFTDADRKAFEALARHPDAQWVVSDLDLGVALARSAEPERLFYGASVTKVFVAAAAIARRGGAPPPHELQMAADMIVVSDNPSWKKLQTAHGSSAVQEFAVSLGVTRSRVFDGWRGEEHGNEVSAADMARFLSATYRNEYPGARTIWALMQAVRTGATRGQYFLPQELVAGGKTGSYRGPSIDPRTRKAAKVDVRHHAMTVVLGGKAYALVVLTDGMSELDVARLAGGLYFTYVAAR